MLGYRQRVSYTDIADDYTGRERTSCVAEGASNVIMNLSGKRTRIGRNSGERFRLYYVKPPKRKAIFGKLSGPRTENPSFYKGVILSFFVWN